MVENARGSALDGDDRGNPTPQWEVFIRAETDEPLRHVGSVAAASGTEAHEHASRLFGWDAADIWLCPAEAVERHTTRGLAATVDSRSNEAAGDSDEPHGDSNAEHATEARDA